MQEARLENWIVIGRGGDVYTPPEKKALCLGGKVYGHPDFKDGESVITSPVMHADGREVMTLNTRYHLGQVCKEYNDWYSEKYNKPLNEDSPFPVLSD